MGAEGRGKMGEERDAREMRDEREREREKRREKRREEKKRNSRVIIESRKTHAGFGSIELHFHSFPPALLFVARPNYHTHSLSLSDFQKRPLKNTHTHTNPPHPPTTTTATTTTPLPTPPLPLPPTTSFPSPIGIEETHTRNARSHPRVPDRR